MSSSSTIEQPVKFPFLRVLLISLVLTMAFASLFLVQMWVQSKINSEALMWRELRMNYIRNLFWGITAPAVLWWTFRFPLERPHFARNLGFHFVGYLAFSVIHAVYRMVVYQYFDAKEPWIPVFGVYMTLMINANLWMWLPIAAIGHIFLAYRRAREREKQARQLQAELAQAELQVLKSQLHPHFLFNTLNSISALIKDDPVAADRMVVRLSTLLRNTLENIGVQEVTLQEELAVLDNYLQIEQTRFQDRLMVKMDIQPETLDARVPYLCLQPLAENAIRHGTSKLTGMGMITVQSRVQRDELVIKITDNGPGPGDYVMGVGMSNTAARLLHLYGRKQGLELRAASPRGAEVTVRLPYHSTEMAQREVELETVEAPA